MSASAVEVDQLAALEARVTKAIETITKLRQERDVARRDVEAARKEAAEAKAAIAKLEDERKNVRGRVEKLLGQIDLVSSES
jgi:FtsZ-binding cell division protein ZapB